MARLFGFIGNRSDFGSKVLEVESAPLRTTAEGTRLAWGVGFYQGGEVLLRRRPVDERKQIQIATLTRQVQTDVLVGFIGPAGEDEPRTQNTQPFRYRQWLFAHSGQVAHFDRLRDRLVSSIPDFLYRNVRGETDSELVFHLFLSFLHDAGKLQDMIPPRQDVITALRSTVALVDRLCNEEGDEDCGPTGLLISNGENIAAFSRSTNMAVRSVRGEDDIEALLPEDGLRRRRLPDMALVRFSIIADYLDEVPRNWIAMPERSTAWLGRLEDPIIEPF